jgi:hypothetical protein
MFYPVILALENMELSVRLCYREFNNCFYLFSLGVLEMNLSINQIPDLKSNYCKENKIGMYFHGGL